MATNRSPNVQPRLDAGPSLGGDLGNSFAQRRLNLTAQLGAAGAILRRELPFQSFDRFFQLDNLEPLISGERSSKLSIMGHQQDGGPCSLCKL